MNILKINVPEGFEIDKDKSTFEEIVFKPINKELPKTWEDLQKINGYFITQASNIAGNITGPSLFFTTTDNKNIFATEAQAKAAIALAQLTQLREVYRQKWEPDWNNSLQQKFCIIKMNERLDKSMLLSSVHFLCFQSTEVRDQFMKNFKDLIEEASPLLFG